MNCSKIMEMYYEDDENSFSLLNQFQIVLHTFFCPHCAEEIENYKSALTIMKEDFFPAPSAETENSIMTLVNSEQTESSYSPSFIPGVPSTRGWVIAGIVLIVSFVTAFFGFDFQKLASESGMSFMLPMGITIGLVLTTYCILFIGSHLKELSERFGL
ncbi:MAG: peptidoglycan-binding protein [Treponema sp.]|nr:peptidoglycan-binding protein [Treponema sp.]